MSGGRQVTLVEEPLAAAIGATIPVVVVRSSTPRRIRPPVGGFGPGAGPYRVNRTV